MKDVGLGRGVRRRLDMMFGFFIWIVGWLEVLFFRMESRRGEIGLGGKVKFLIFNMLSLRYLWDG